MVGDAHRGTPHREALRFRRASAPSEISENQK